MEYKDNYADFASGMIQDFAGCMLSEKLILCLMEGLSQKQTSALIYLEQLENMKKSGDRYRTSINVFTDELKNQWQKIVGK